jgi:hypothetical protein
MSNASNSLQDSSVDLRFKMMKASTKANQCNSYEKCIVNLREWQSGQSCQNAKHPLPCEKHGGACKTAWGANHCINGNLQIKKWKVLHQVNCNCKNTSLTECTHVQLSLRIKKIEWLQQKIMQPIMKRHIVTGTTMPTPAHHAMSIPILNESVLARARKLSCIQ